MLAEQSGITAKGTRRDQAGAIARQLGTDDQALIQLGREADYATFSGQDIESGQATTYWTGVDQLRKAMLASLPRFRKDTYTTFPEKRGYTVKWARSKAARRMSSARVRRGRRHDHRLHPYRDDQ